jgi:hypothetical protein
MAVSKMKGLTLAVRHMFAPPGDRENNTATLATNRLRFGEAGHFHIIIFGA